MACGAVALAFGALTASPAAAALDNYQCRKAKDLKVPAKFVASTVIVIDQFGVDTTEVKKPFLHCSPASINGAPVLNPADHLTCYKTKPALKLAGPNISVTDQFGTTKLSQKKNSLLCVPGSKTIIP
jgi:hypothetical protein